MAALMNIKQKKEETTHDYICRFEAELDKVDDYSESVGSQNVHLGPPPRPSRPCFARQTLETEPGIPAG